MNSWLQKQWASYSLWHILLIPLSWIFSAIVYIRAKLYKTGWLKSTRLSVPVIVIGNINVGGTGKTPLVIWLAEQLQQQGYTPAIISRGYGGSTKLVAEVFGNSNPAEVGDEPVLIAKRTHCPMFVGANRVAAGQALLQAHPQCNVIISDDGLQHYRLQRNVEIALINSSQLIKSNLQLLPAGSLREKITRLQYVDAIVDSALQAAPIGALQTPLFNVQLFNMQLQGDIFVNLADTQSKQPASYFAGKSTNQTIVAIAGIANPERFLKKLTELGLQFEQQVFADHHAFTAQDLAPFANKIILMTEKDAVKCYSFATPNVWYLPVAATVTGSASLVTLVLKQLRN
ncbi:MAG: tetraacyldisaccharide 4'-kinase [Methylotenera sp.]|nr:tetraacyldisaccharide 4'-kinase [Methylotenera sp.]